MIYPAAKPLVAIACGGTGGHLYPGLAVAGELQRRDCDVALLVSPKDVDQQAVKSVQGMEVVTLPAVGLQDRNYFSFARSFFGAYLAARKFFQRRPPAAILAMGGFTGAPPVLAARRVRARAFLHESNTVPGRANRFLARLVEEAFVGFPEAASRLRAGKVSVTGTPVRPRFSPSAIRDPRSAVALGLDPDRPVMLVVGGSQGARGLNDLVLSALPLLREMNWQWLHLAGAADQEKVRAAYAGLGLRAVVKPFLAEMDLALGAATACVSRAGASSLAEIAAMRLPSALVPLPTAADHHQYFNAAAFAQTGAAVLLDQKNSTPEKVAAMLAGLVGDEAGRSKMKAALERWHAPAAAAQIAEHILAAIAAPATFAGQASPAHGVSTCKAIA